MEEEINYNIFYISDKNDDWLDLNNDGIILSNRTIVLKKQGSLRPKVIFDKKIYGESILDVYEVFFEYGLDIEHNKKVVEYFNRKSHKFFKGKTKEKIQEKLKGITYLFKYKVVDEGQLEEDVEENYHKVKAIRK